MDECSCKCYFEAEWQCEGSPFSWESLFACENVAWEKLLASAELLPVASSATIGGELAVGSGEVAIQMGLEPVLAIVLNSDTFVTAIGNPNRNPNRNPNPNP